MSDAPYYCPRRRRWYTTTAALADEHNATSPALTRIARRLKLGRWIYPEEGGARMWGLTPLEAKRVMREHARPLTSPTRPTQGPRRLNPPLPSPAPSPEIERRYERDRPLWDRTLRSTATTHKEN